MRGRSRLIGGVRYQMELSITAKVWNRAALSRALHARLVKAKRLCSRHSAGISL